MCLTRCCVWRIVDFLRKHILSADLRSVQLWLKFSLMRGLFILIAHLLTTVARLARPGGIGAVAAESVALKHQLLILKRGRRRAPILTPWDRLVLGVCTVLASPKRLGKMAVILKPCVANCYLLPGSTIRPHTKKRPKAYAEPKAAGLTGRGVKSLQSAERGPRR